MVLLKYILLFIPLASFHTDLRGSDVSIKPPFVGKKKFAFRPMETGSGTPAFIVEINSNYDVYFILKFKNKLIKSNTEIFFAGKFKKVLLCRFNYYENETLYFRITINKIYQVDRKNNLLHGNECCTYDNLSLEDKCPCINKFD